MLQAALSAGLTAEGCEVADLGVLPTPGVAWVAAAEGMPAAVISASHNPFADNGVKLFAAGGRKLDDGVEAGLEAEMQRLLASLDAGRAGTATAAVGTIVPHDGRHAYASSLPRQLQGRRLDGVHVVLDCANGAAYEVAPGVFADLGANVDVLFDRPDGRNINDGCGSTHPGTLQREVVTRGADVGLAFDGDADRVLAVDERGALVDGDHLLAVFAIDMARRGVLVGETVVITVMANLGLRQALGARGITVVETPVGDRHVLAALARGGWSLGGEQSGHLIFADLATTGDGLLTGLLLLDVMARSGSPLSELAAVMVKSPQVLRNVEVGDVNRLAEDVDFWAQVKELEIELGDTGRVLVRPSGTEPVVRVMVEAATVARAEAACATLCSALEGSAVVGSGRVPR